MADVKVIFGSTTGATEMAAKEIARRLGAALVNVADAKAGDFAADVLILGTSTWGIGDLQDDWDAKIGLLDNLDLTGKKVALFGMGDQFGFADTYVDGMGTLRDKVLKRGAAIIGETSAAGYSYSGSTAETDGKLCGLALDDTNEADLTPQRIQAWTEHLKAEIGG